MVAPARKRKNRVMRDIDVETPLAGLTVIRFAVVQDGLNESYAVIRWADSCEVKVCHRHHQNRTYRVVCRVGSGEPSMCSCGDYRYRGGPCKHMAAVAKLTDLGHLTFPVLTDAGHDRGHGCE